MNQTRGTEFILLGFGNLHSFSIVVFIFFLIIFLCTVTGNLLMIILFSTNVQLQTPMYYFLCHLSTSDLVISTTIVPNMLGAIILAGKKITYFGCITQLCFYAGTITSECFLLSAMSYDRYLAVCNPLRYSSIMDIKCQVCLSVLPWLLGYTLILTGLFPILDFDFCHDNIIDYFYCDLSPLHKLSCSDTSTADITALLVSVPVFICPCSVITVTYVYIFRTVIKMPSTTGKQKTYYTCSSHLTVVVIFYGTLMIKYMLPMNEKILLSNKIAALLHTVLTPMFNPLIYSLRNQKIKLAVKKLLANSRKFSNTNVS